MSGWRQRLLPLLLVIPALFAYRNSFDGVFVFDDRPSIVQNPNVRNAAPWAHPLKAMQAPRNITLSGRPVASFSFAMNYAFAPTLPFKEDVWGYHATNLAIHLISTLLLFGIVRRTANSTMAGAATAILWSVHPLTTGAVTYIVQRVESLMAMFMLLTLYCAIRAWNKPGLKSRPTSANVGRNFSSGAADVGRNFRSGAWSLAAVIACALGMGTKEAMVGAPLIVLAWDWVFIKTPFREIFRERWMLYAGLEATWILLFFLVAIDARPLSSGFHFPEWSWTTYFLTQTSVITHYLRLAFVPDPLVLDYDVRQIEFFSQVAVQFVFLSALFALSLWGFVRRHSLGFAGLAFFILLAPTSSVLPIVTEIAAEHRMYLPLAVIIATLMSSKRNTPDDYSPLRNNVLLAAIVVALGIPLAMATYARNDVYASETGIWFDTIQKQPKNARARNNYASNLLQTGQSTAAEEHLRVAVTESPRFAAAHANLGVALVAEGRTAEALPHFERALELNPFYTDAYEDIAEAYAATNRPAKAVKYFLKTLDLRPDDVALLNKTAWILATSVDPAARDGRQAIVLAEHAVKLTDRRDASSLDTLAASYAEAGRFDEAIPTGAAALALAHARGDQAFPEVLTQRLTLYRAHKPVRM